MHYSVKFKIKFILMEFSKCLKPLSLNYANKQNPYLMLSKMEMLFVFTVKVNQLLILSRYPSRHGKEKFPD
ncbi:hypothetical protein THIOM_004209 [Candidatus Thiomargarita nelsonii]|uniref:Uncharacterized protein n=1 Tax=Candidatus Thiomargarita nelsonii TaxID=1003181 RepID=A0A176RWH8_9GAMM|nr:hypothetical protein THIOM_004209 [Candidatus Thiomargarita nelsonii]